MKETNLVGKLDKSGQRTAASHLLLSIQGGRSDEYRSYFSRRDQAYFREGRKKSSPSTVPSHMLQDQEHQTPSSEFEIPTVFSQVDTARARLSSIFLSAQPIFKTVTPPDFAKIGDQYDAVIEADAAKFGWMHHLSLAHLDGLKYDVAVVEVDWTTLQTTKVTRDPETEQLARNRQVTYSGNSIKRIHPSNAFWDISVPLHEVSSRGDYAGYTEPYTLTRLLELLDELAYAPAEIRKMLYPTIQEQADPDYINIIAGHVSIYQAPRVIEDTPSVSPAESGMYFDLTDDEISEMKSARQRAVNAKYEVTKLYIRTIPAVLGFPASADEDIIPRLYKVYLLNGCKLLSIEEANYDHNYMPMVLTSTMQDGVGHTSKSFSHNMESLQALANKLIQADVRSSQRVIGDRAIYNPHMIDPRHANNPSSTGKIPLKTSSPTADVRAAYHAIPYNDPALGARFQQAVSLLGFGNEISGANPVLQGQFVKGNKTNQQFQESMSASDSRLISLAMGLYCTFYFPIQEIIKYNIAQYQTSENTYSQSLERTVQINSEELKQVLPQFKLANGLVSAARMINVEALTAAIQSLPQIPELSMQYNIPKMFVDLMSNGSELRMSKYELTPEEQQAKMEQMQQMQQMQQAQEAQNSEGGGGLMGRLRGAMGG
jgi:hypothetical protein